VLIQYIKDNYAYWQQEEVAAAEQIEERLKNEQPELHEESSQS
jgi:hypothetical protein